jgi:phospholipid/cholesterol/gamma-HCH transport system substrate-binding protein
MVVKCTFAARLTAGGTWLAEAQSIELEIRPTARAKTRVVSVIAVAIFLTLVLCWMLIGGGGDLFAQRSTVTTYMPDGTGLSDISEVHLSGIPVGMVKTVEISGLLDPQRAVRVKMRVLKRYLRSIPVDSQTNISFDNPVGWAFVDISPGKSPAPLPEDGVLQSEPLKQAIDRADMVRVLEDNLTDVDKLLIEVSSGDTKTGKFVLGDAEYKNALAGIGRVDQGLRVAISPKSPIGQALFSSNMYDSVHQSVMKLDQTLDSIQRGEGTAGQFFASDAQYNSILQQLKNVRASLADLNAGKGPGDALLQNDDAYRNIQKLLAETDQAISSINAGAGPAGQLLANAQLYEALSGSLKALQAMVNTLRTDPRKYERLRVFGGSSSAAK